MSKYIDVPLSPKALRFVMAAVETEIGRLRAMAAYAASEDTRADAANDYVFYCAILEDMRKRAPLP